MEPNLELLLQINHNKVPKYLSQDHLQPLVEDRLIILINVRQYDALLNYSKEAKEKLEKIGSLYSSRQTELLYKNRDLRRAKEELSELKSKKVSFFDAFLSDNHSKKINSAKSVYDALKEECASINEALNYLTSKQNKYLIMIEDVKLYSITPVGYAKLTEKGMNLLKQK